jgi:hypothetical protein
MTRWGEVGTAITDMVARVSTRLEMMGFLPYHPSAYRIEFLREGNFLRFETEPHYPGLSVSIKLADGSVFEFGALAQAIDPGWYASYSQQGGKADTLGLDMMLDFLALHSDQIFHHHAAFERRYQELVTARMAALRLLPR